MGVYIIHRGIRYGICRKALSSVHSGKVTRARRLEECDSVHKHGKDNKYD